MKQQTKARLERKATLEWVPLGLMHVSPYSQRELNQNRVERLLSDFDPDLLGNPVLSRQHDGTYHILDGQHRTMAAHRWLGAGWEEQRIQCWVYTGLTESEEADMFDRLNDTLRLTTFQQYRIRVNAGRTVESEVDRIVRESGLRTGNATGPGVVKAVGTLVTIYKRSDAPTLQRTLRIVIESFGDAGLQGPIIDGISLVCQRYNSALNDDRAIQRLSTVSGGLSGLQNQAERFRQRTGLSRGQCIAAAVVDAVNRGKGGTKLAGWWRN
jgi:hypothetical protein